MISLLAVRGDVSELDARSRAILLDRATAPDGAIAAEAQAILDEVRRDGDAALRRLARRLDGTDLPEIEIPRARWIRALAQLDPALRAALARAALNIREVHEAFRPVPTEMTTRDGVRLGRRPHPLARAGVYAPGGRASYPSSVLMGALPARAAGVREVVVCSPPAGDGLPPPLVLAAAELAGVDRVFAVGGAGAIAAMAWGTATVPRVDCIVGPGNAWVAEAKARVAGMVRIDAPAGPSELLVLADDSADAAAIAREMAAQAEHDPRAAVALVTTSRALAADVARALQACLGGAARAAVIREALAARGAVLTARSMPEAVAFAESFAPEHLLLSCRDASAIAPRVRAAGTIFIGVASSVVFGDYLTGANHVLPTGGAARVWSGLSTGDFVRWTTWQEASPPAARAMADDAGLLARAEGLPAHALAADSWSAAG